MNQFIFVTSQRFSSGLILAECPFTGLIVAPISFVASTVLCVIYCISYKRWYYINKDYHGLVFYWSTHGSDDSSTQFILKCRILQKVYELQRLVWQDVPPLLLVHGLLKNKSNMNMHDKIRIMCNFSS